MAKKVIVVLAEGFEEIEAMTVIDILRRAELSVTVAGLGGKKIKAAHGVIVEADTTLQEAGSSFDACVLPGGVPGAPNLAASNEVNELIKKMYSENKLVAAICASPAIVLAPQGILKGKKATCYPGMEDGLGPDTERSEERVVKDGNVITSRGPATAMEFALAIVESLAGKEVSEKVGKAVLVV